MRQKEITIELPETLVDEDEPYRLLINNQIQINLTFYDRADDPELDFKNTEKIIFPLPRAKGTWMVKTQVNNKLILIDI